ncbi:hypothetical protein [Aquimarina longa]|uniref:hypothetical protein n=1 Tax=Aquimarina longa TaxID=1080221 RepID=UPI00078658C8|nr:hypothetical protein [Aquimarina longa]
MIINYSLSFKRLDRFTFQFNNNQEAISTQIRQSMLATAREVIKVYGAFLTKSNKISPLDFHNLPSLRTNNIQLAKITQASGRTMQRHIKRLLECGILTKKIWHGSHSSYELFINPKILWINGLGSVDNTQNNRKEEKTLTTDNQVFKKINSSKCPHSYTYKRTYKTNNTLIAVEKLRNSWRVNFGRASGLTQKTTKKETKKTRRKDLLAEDARRKDAWRDQIEFDEKTAQGRQTGAEKIKIRQHKNCEHSFCDPSRHAFLLQHVDELWKLAKEKLYKNIWLNKRQCDIAKTLLYKWYEPVSNERIKHTHQVYIERIDLVVKYIEKDPLNRFVTLPYLYFDCKNPKGFAGTKSWYEAEKAYQIKSKFQRIVREQIRKFKKNEAKDTAEARPRLEVYRECEQRLDKLEIPALVKQFYAAVIKTPKQYI